ncbi:hypothetical protein HNR74_004740 [Flammeovirga kamogawensis]|nr:hypothetical protein [Flammeovirga kamogawensis]
MGYIKTEFIDYNMLFLIFLDEMNINMYFKQHEANLYYL